MKLSKFAALFLSISVFSLTSNSPNVLANTDDDLESYMTECDAPRELYDAEAMAQTMADPKQFSRFMTELGKPATAKAFVQCLYIDEQRDTVIASMSNPNNMMIAMLPFMNPQTYSAWMAASMDAQTYQPAFNFMNPMFYTQWLAGVMNTDIYQSAMDDMQTTR